MKYFLVLSHSGSDVGLGLTQLLFQALRQGRQRVLGGAVQMSISRARYEEKTVRVVGRHKHFSLCIDMVSSLNLEQSCKVL